MKAQQQSGHRRDRIRVGVGSAFSDDRIDTAFTLAEKGELDYLVFECLAERTIARSHVRTDRA